MTITEQDEQLGLELANQMRRVYVKAGHTHSNIGHAIAKGIALGRQQGLALAASLIEKELVKFSEIEPVIASAGS